MARATGEATGTYAINQGNLVNSNYTISYTGKTFAINQLAVTVTANSGQTKTYGQIDPTLAYTSSPAVGSSLANGNTIAFTGALTRQAGETVTGSPYTIGIGTLVNSNYSVTYNADNFAITQLAVSVLANTGQAKVYGQTDPILTYTSSPAIGSALANGNTIAFTGTLTRAAGETVATYAINQGMLVNSNYAISYTSKNFAINQLAVTVTANSGQTKTYGQIDPTLTYTSSPVVGSALANGNTIAFAGALARAIGESVSGSPYAIGIGTLVNSNYSITYNADNFAITPLAVTVTPTNGQSKTYGQSDPTFTYITSPAVGSVMANGLTISLTGALTRDAGETVAGSPYTIRIGTLSNSNYTISCTSKSFSITPLAITGNFTVGASKVYDGNTSIVILTRTLAGVLSPDDVSIGGNAKFDNKNIGTGKAVTLNPVYLVGNQATNYTLSGINTTTSAITKRTLTLSNFGADSKYYDGTTIAAGVGFVDDRVEGDILSFGRDAAFNNPDLGLNKPVYYTNILISGGTDKDNYVLASTTGTAYANITSPVLTITANNVNKPYGTVLTGGSSSTAFTVTGLRNNETIGSVTIAYGAGKEAGDAFGTNTGSVTPSLVTGGTFIAANYTIVYVTGNIEVTKANLSVIATDLLKANGATLSNVSGSTAFTSTGLRNGETIGSVTISYGAGADATSPGGIYTGSITPSAAIGGSFTSGNYNITYLKGNITIETIQLTVTANASQTKVYGTTDPVFTYTYSPTQSPAVIFTGSLVRATGENAGSSYAITKGSLAAGSNYTITFVPANFSVIAKPIIVTANASQTKVYGSTDPALTYTYTPSLLGYDVFAGAPGRAAGENVSSNYSITQGTLSAGSNYAITFVPSNFSVTTKQITVTANGSQTKVYGSADPVLTYTFTPSLIGSDVFTGAAVRTAGENIGSAYEIKKGTLSAGSNYAITFVSANYSITTKQITVTANALQTKVYGTTDQVFTYSLSPALSFADVFTGSLSRVYGVNVGTYPILLGSLSAGNNYTISFIPADFKITKAVITATADMKERRYLEFNPVLTITYSGFAYDDSFNNLDVLPVAVTTSTGVSGAGVYDITLSGGADNNYSFIFRKGILTVQKANQVISFEAIPSGLRTTQEYLLVASSISGMPVSFLSSDPLIVSISGVTMTVIREGTVSITANQAGNQNWNPATSVSVATTTEPTFDNMTSLFTPNGDNMNDYWHIPNIETYGTIEVKVYNRFGKLVYESSAYANNWDGNFNGGQLPSASYYYIIKSSIKGMIKGVVNLVR